MGIISILEVESSVSEIQGIFVLVGFFYFFGGLGIKVHGFISGNLRIVLY